eukprot:709734-Amphidinium_carterae.1
MLQTRSRCRGSGHSPMTTYIRARGQCVRADSLRSCTPCTGHGEHGATCLLGTFGSPGRARSAQCAGYGVTKCAPIRCGVPNWGSHCTPYRGTSCKHPVG